jgi:hypothetical protein
VQVIEECLAMLRQARVAFYLQSCWKLCRDYGVAHFAVAHQLSALRAQADDGTAISKVSAGLLADAETRVIFRQASDQKHEARAMLGLSAKEVEPSAHIRTESFAESRLPAGHFGLTIGNVPSASGGSNTASASAPDAWSGCWPGWGAAPTKCARCRGAAWIYDETTGAHEQHRRHPVLVHDMPKVGKLGCRLPIHERERVRSSRPTSRGASRVP